MAHELVRASWERSKQAGVSAELKAATLQLRDDGLNAARERHEWVSLAEAVLAPQLELVKASGHVITLFDHEVQMLSASGDPHVLHQLDDIHFIPGSNWSEASVGTNGPGTAFITGQPVHVVGREHFCEAWHPWHCAAVPLRDSAGGVMGVLDLSGPADRADAYSLQLARALGSNVEQALQGRAWRRRLSVLERFAELASRYPTDLIIAVDGDGFVLQATPSARLRGLPERVRVPHGVSGFASAPPQAAWLEGATIHAVCEGRLRVGSCLVLREAQRPKARSSAVQPATRYQFDDLVGASLREVVSLARSASSTDLPVLITGESGVGKELFAHSIHAESPRRRGPFVAVNCGALPRELLESELFGYAGGAFSGARVEGSVGRFEAAHEGTLFLDEIGELPLAAQAALLRVLQDQVITPVGGSPRQIDVRVVAATNRDLEAAVRAGTFRLDLFHRLNVVELAVPALRDRRDDLPELITHLVDQVERETGLPVVMDESVEAALLRHDWPGNVRELENVLRRLAVVGRTRPVTVADLPFQRRVFETPVPAPIDRAAQGLLDVIHSTRNMAEAAARLGVNRSTLYRQLERCGLKPARTVKRGS